jgi:GTP-binding protein YchF
MRIGIMGLAQSGKKTLFRLLTGAKSVPAMRSDARGEFPFGMGTIPDERVDRLAQLYKPKKIRFAEIEWVIFPGMPAETKSRDHWLEEARKLDGLCYVVRQFGDEGVYHEDGSIDPARDIDKLDLELTITDLALVETRLERLAKENAKKTAAERAKQVDILEKLKTELEAGKSLRGLELSKSEEDRLGGLRFLSRKDCLLVVNVDEELVANAEGMETLAGSMPSAGREVICLSAKIESELAEIEDPAERAEFLASLGIVESGAGRMARSALRVLGRISFLTVGPDEVRAWLVRKGALAPEAAGEIHTDFERGFIRAEHMLVDELLRAGSEAKLKEQGKVALRGKDYAVADGDILHILASS